MGFNEVNTAHQAVLIEATMRGRDQGSGPRANGLRKKFFPTGLSQEWKEACTEEI